MSITKEDLYTNQYDYETLKTNIYAVSLLDILKTQRLTSDFCAKYILNIDFQLLEEEQQINIDTIKKYQPHIQDIDLVIALNLVTVNRICDKRVDSIDDFETYANNHI